MSLFSHMQNVGFPWTRLKLMKINGRKNVCEAILSIVNAESISALCENVGFLVTWLKLMKINGRKNVCEAILSIVNAESISALCANVHGDKNSKINSHLN